MKLKLLIVLCLMTLITSSASLQADFIQCSGGGVCNGTDNADIINGSPLFDVILAGAGDEIIFGNDGPDTIYTQEDNDIAFGGNGSDFIDAHEGDDMLLPGPDDGVYNQQAIGEDGNDSFYTFASETSTCLFLTGNSGQDTAHLIGFGPYSAHQPFGQTGWVEGWVLVVDPIAGGNVLISVKENSDGGMETIHGLLSPSVTIIGEDEGEALDCPELHPDIDL